MKGILRKTEHGWQVEYEVINSYRKLQLHPDEANSTHIKDRMEVSFEREFHADGNVYATLYPTNDFVNDKSEISDKEIQKEAIKFSSVESLLVQSFAEYYFELGAKWYREQLKNK